MAKSPSINPSQAEQQELQSSSNPPCKTPAPTSASQISSSRPSNNRYDTNQIELRTRPNPPPGVFSHPIPPTYPVIPTMQNRVPLMQVPVQNGRHLILTLYFHHHNTLPQPPSHLPTTTTNPQKPACQKPQKLAKNTKSVKTRQYNNTINPHFIKIITNPKLQNHQ